MPESNPDQELAEAFAELIEQPEQEPTGEAVEEAKEEADAEEGEVEETEAETDEDVAEEAEDKEESRTLKVNGEEIPEEEVIAGYMKDADYRRKTAEVATIRKEADADRERYQKGIDVLMQQLAVADQLLRDSGINLTEDQLDNLAVTDPAEFVRMQRIQQKNAEKVSSLRMALQKAEEAKMAEYKALLDKNRRDEHEALAREYPEFRKPETWNRLTDYLKSDAGGKFEQELIDSVTDRRFAMLAEKARKYDAMKARQADKEKKVESSGRVIRPNAAKPAQRPEAAIEYQRNLSAAKKGNRDALAALMENL